MPNISTIVTRLRSEGLRHTPIRAAILDALTQYEHGIEIAAIIIFLQKHGIKANKTTVYRQLTTLTTHNIVTECRTPDGVLHYELTHDQHHHHFICRNCRRIEALEMDTIETELTTLTTSLARRGFRVADHTLELIGTCPDCK